MIQEAYDFQRIPVFSMRPSPERDTVEFVYDYARLMELIRDTKVTVKSLFVRNRHCVVVTYAEEKDFLKPSACYNPVIASYLTSYARIHLYEFAETFGKNLCYMDTGIVHIVLLIRTLSLLFSDSAIGVINGSLSESQKQLVGSHLGCWSSETGNESYSYFMSCGAKSWAAETTHNEI
jgi:hypothetical protein